MTSGAIGKSLQPTTACLLSTFHAVGPTSDHLKGEILWELAAILK
jgi:hypothetical protein